MPTPASPLLQSERKEPPSRGRMRRVELRPLAEVSIALLDTIPMVAVGPRGIEQPQQDIFNNDIDEDVSFRSTLALPAIVLLSEEQVRLDQRQVVTNIAGGAAIAGIGDMLSTTLRFLGNVITTHVLSQSAYGIFVAAFTPVAIVGSAASVGLDITTLRFLSTYRAKGEHGLAAGMIHFVVWMTLISGLLCGAVFFLFATALAHFVYRSDVYELPFKEMALLIPLMALQLVFASGLQALKAIKWKVYVDRLIQPGLTLILMGVFYLLGLRLEAVILATICGFLAVTITGQFLLSRAARPITRDVVYKVEVKAWLRFTLAMSFNSVLQLILSSIDILSLAIFAPSAQVGLYAVADRTGTLVLMPFTALAAVFSPLIAEYYVRGDREQLANILKVVTKWVFSLSLPVFLCFCVFHEPILSVFSMEYAAGGSALIIVSLGNLAFAGAGPALLLLLMLGRPHLILANAVVMLTTNVALAFLLVPRFNTLGAAVAVTASLIIASVVGLVAVYWNMRIHPYRWDMLKPMVAGSVAAGVSFPLLQVLRVHGGRWVVLEELGLIIPFVLIYVLVLALLRFSEEDIMVFNAIRTKLGSLARHEG